MDALRQDGLLDRLGTACGRWRLERLIGAGGAAAVYAAVDDGGAHAAVKVLHASFEEGSSARRRFVREASISNLIDHPGVVRVQGDGTTADGTPFIVMELLEGETLETRWIRKGGRLAPAEVLWIADDVLDILRAAHAIGVVHRDVKPGNVFITKAKDIKLLDFGVARVRAALQEDGGETRAGAVLGTLDFMAPEQARGDAAAVGVQTDLWGVGATMFSLLAGRTVFEGTTVREVLTAVTGQAPVPLRSAAPDIPPAVAELVDVALSVDTGRRWTSAKAMQDAVREVAAMLRRAGDEAPVSGSLRRMPPALASVEPPPPSIAPPLPRLRIPLPGLDPSTVEEPEPDPEPPPEPATRPNARWPVVGAVAAAVVALGIVGWLLAR